MLLVKIRHLIHYSIYCTRSLSSLKVPSSLNLEPWSCSQYILILKWENQKQVTIEDLFFCCNVGLQEITAEIFFSNNNNNDENDISYLIPFSMHYKLKVNCDSSNPFVFSVAIFSSTFHLLPWSGFWPKCCSHISQEIFFKININALRMLVCHAVKLQRHYPPILPWYRLFLNYYQGRAH